MAQPPSKRREEKSDNPAKKIKVEPPEYDNLEDVEIISEFTQKDKTIVENIEVEGGDGLGGLPSSNNQPAPNPSSPTSTAAAPQTNDNLQDDIDVAKKPKDAMIKIDSLETLSSIDSNNVFLCESLFRDFGSLKKSLEKVGPKIAHLNINLDICSKHPIRFLQSLSKNCPNLGSLVIRERNKVQLLPEDYWDKKQWDEDIKFPKLTKLTISSEAKLFNDFPFFSALMRTSNIEKLSIQLDCDKEKKDLKFLKKFLEKLEVSPELKRIKSFKIKSEPIKNRFIQLEEVKRIKRLDLPSLEVLKIGAGIWGNVSSGIFEGMIEKFAKNLKKFAVQGTFGGHVNDGYTTNVKIALPQIPNLISFVFQPEYVYEEIFETEKIQTQKAKVLDIDAEVPKMIKLFLVSVYFPHSNTLEELILGNMIEITTVPHDQGNPEFAFGFFRNLKVFRVGSAWNKIAKYPSKKLEKLEEIQFGDGLKDPWEIQRVKNEINTIKKVWIYLPAPEVLRQFFRSFWNYGIEEIRIKTRYFFHTTLNSILTGSRKRASSAIEYGKEHDKIRLLKEYGKWKEWVEFYDIDLPGLNELERTKGKKLKEKAIKDFKGSLREFTHEHVERQLRIPKGNEHWTSPDCQFHEEIIGFELQYLTEKAYYSQMCKLSQSNNKMGFLFMNYKATESTEKKIYNCRLWDAKKAEKEWEKMSEQRENMIYSNDNQCIIKKIEDN